MEGGVLDLEAGTLQAGAVQVLGGAIADGNGTVAGNLFGAAHLQPGGAGAAGKLSVAALSGSALETGDLIQNGVLDADIGGASAGTGFDELNIAGNATLGGTLNLALINGYEPTSTTQTFPIVTFAPSTGTFGSVTGLVDPNPNDPYEFQLQYNPTNVSLL